MALKLSSKLQSAMMKSGGLAQLMSNCVLKYYTGSQPATANLAPTGTLLCTFSSASGALTREVKAAGSVTFSGTVAGATCTGITVNSIQTMLSTFTDSTGVLADFATGVAKLINDNPKNWQFEATASAGKVTITAKPGVGVQTWAVVSAVTTITKADVNFGTEVAGTAPVNGLNWGTPVAGVLPKLETQTWSGVAAAGGIAGYYRIEAAVSDAGGIDSTESIYRIDGAIGTTGAELNMGNTTITSGLTQTITSFALTLPTA